MSVAFPVWHRTAPPIPYTPSEPSSAFLPSQFPLFSCQSTRLCFLVIWWGPLLLLSLRLAAFLPVFLQSFPVLLSTNRPPSFLPRSVLCAWRQLTLFAGGLPHLGRMPYLQWINACLLSIFYGSLKSIFSTHTLEAVPLSMSRSKWKSLVFFPYEKG